MQNRKSWNRIGAALLLALLIFLPLSTGEQTGTVNELHQAAVGSTVSAEGADKTGVQANKTELTRTDVEDIDEELAEKIDAILADDQLIGSITGVSVRRASDGTLLYTHDGDVMLHPASNQKMITSISALETLGPDYRFSTEVRTDGNLKGKVLHGNVYLVGKGDPTLMQDGLEKLAKQLKQQGIHKIKGDLIGDDSWYDDVRLSTDLNWDDEPYYTGAQISALTMSPNEDYDTGTVIVEVDPGKKPGSKPKVNIIPETSYVKVINKAKTIAGATGNTISIEREHGTNHMIITGELPQEANQVRQWRSVWEPTGYVLDVFHRALQAEGIKLIGNSKVKTGTAPAKTKQLAVKKSIPLKDILITFLKLSNNGHGEILTKEVGKVVHDEGSWDKGLEVAANTLKDLNLNTEYVLLRDGSGMSHKNLIQANELSYLFYAIQDKDWFPYLETALPLAGHPERLVGGTLRYRMTEEPTKENVIAKTGSLTGVSTLAGYVTSKDGEKLTFSIMMNNYKSGSMTDIQDEIATVLASHEFE